MTKVILDKATLAKLHDLKEQLEVYDESGHIVGYFRPAIDHSLHVGTEVPFTNEQLERFEQEPGGRSLTEILADLQQPLRELQEFVPEHKIRGHLPSRVFDVEGKLIFESPDRDFDDADLRRANLEGADLEGALFYGTVLDHANLRGADLYWAGLFQASLRFANLEHASLRGADCKKANFEGANLRNADFGRDNLNGATQVQGANFAGATLDGTNFDGCQYDENTTFPLGFKPESAGMHLVKIT